LYWWHGTVPHFSHDIKSACININTKYIDFISTVTTYSFCALWTSWLIFSLSHATFSTTWLTDWWCTGTTNNVVRMCIYYTKVCSKYHRNCLIHLQMERLRKKLQWCKQHSVIWVAQLLMCQTIWTTAFWTIKWEKCMKNSRAMTNYRARSEIFNMPNESLRKARLSEYIKVQKNGQKNMKITNKQIHTDIYICIATLPWQVHCDSETETTRTNQVRSASLDCKWHAEHHLLVLQC